MEKFAEFCTTLGLTSGRRQNSLAVFYCVGLDSYEMEDGELEEARL